MSAEGWKWSGHTHPGFEYRYTQASYGDYEVLRGFGHKTSTIYNASGQHQEFIVEDW